MQGDIQSDDPLRQSMIAMKDVFSKPLYIALLCSFLFQCESRRLEGIKFLEEFDVPCNYPDELTYTYHLAPTDDSLVIRYSCHVEVDEKILRLVTRFNDELISETMYRISGGRKHLISEDRYEYPGETANQLEKLKAVIHVFGEIESDKKFNDVEAKLKYTNSIGFRTTIHEKNSFERDTVLNWRDNIVSGLKFNYTRVATKRIKFLPFIERTWTEEKGHFFLAQGIGLFSVQGTQNDEWFEMQLVSIEKGKPSL
jgi:hypothetical protein